MKLPLLKRCIRGVGLVELMVAMAIGLFLIGGLIQVYLANKQTYETTEGLSRMQENLRFAAEKVAEDIRMAGFMPCRQTDKIANVLNTPTVWWEDFFNQGVNGFDGDHTDDVTGVNDHGAVGITAIGAPFTNHVAGTDIVVTLRGGENSYSVVSHTPTAASIKLNKFPTNLDDGDIVLICDLNNASVMQLSTASSTNVNIVHNTGTGSPGNCTKGLGFPRTCTTNGTAYTYGPDSHLVKFEPLAYYIGTNNSGGRSLYRVRHINTATTVSMISQELVEGIENMQLLYGVDDDDDDTADKYVRADEVLNTSATWNDVVSVRLGLLAQTPKEIALNNDTGTYKLVGTNVSPDTADRKQRYQYNTTIKIRNRGEL